MYRVHQYLEEVRLRKLMDEVYQAQQSIENVTRLVPGNLTHYKPEKFVKLRVFLERDGGRGGVGYVWWWERRGLNGEVSGDGLVRWRRGNIWYFHSAIHSVS